MTTVLFETLWHSFSDGWSIASRAYARAMHAAGLTVQLHSREIMLTDIWVENVERPDPECLEEVGHLTKRDKERDLYVFSCTLTGEWGTQFTLQPLSKVRRPRAFYTMFERRQVGASTIAWLNKIDAVWVPCSANADVLHAAGAGHVTWIPLPYFDDDPHLGLPPPRREPRTFLWVGRWEPRKAPDNLIRAFLRAFKPGEAKLILKLGTVPWRGNYPGPEEVMVDELGPGLCAWSPWQIAEGVEVIRGRLTPRQMVDLHARSDVYCSASRGEGLDLPAYAAKLGGRRVVTTDSGGPRDFLTETDILVPATGDVPCDPIYRWDPGSTFADYDLDALVAALQKARSDTRRPEHISSEFHHEVVGENIKNWVEEIVARIPVEPKPEPSLVDFGQWVLDGEG